MKAYWLETGEPISAEELNANGVTHEVLDVSNYKNDIERIMKANSYSSQDIVELTPLTPNLPAILAKFDKEHLHTDDEVRFVLAGSGIFDVRAGANSDGKWMRIEVFTGDYISVPANRYHRFFCMGDNFIRCVRLFKENPVWTPFYREEKEKALA
jgi:1,2-dihydroxy-3-keto-5-methylthiopentene dioxygenase